MASSLTSDQIAAPPAPRRRLPAGKRPAASPPPLAHSDPWYEVVERDAVEVLHDDVWVDGSGGAARIVINQHAGWDLLDHALDAQGRVFSAPPPPPPPPPTW